MTDPAKKHVAATDVQLTLFDEPEKKKPAIIPATEIFMSGKKHLSRKR